MKFRLASKADAAALGEIHLYASSIQPSGFMYRLGRAFFVKYYEILLDAGSSTVLCAINDQGGIDGFVAGTLDSSSRVPALKKRRLELLLASTKNLLFHPSLIPEILKRQQSGTGSGNTYVVTSGAHLDFWAWRAVDSKNNSFALLLKWLALANLFGVKEVFGEVDMANDLILKAHQIMGAKIVDQIITPDGRKRFIICYRLK